MDNFNLEAKVNHISISETGRQAINVTSRMAGHKQWPLVANMVR